MFSLARYNIQNYNNNCARADVSHVFIYCCNRVNTVVAIYDAKTRLQYNFHNDNDWDDDDDIIDVKPLKTGTNVGYRARKITGDSTI